MGSYRAEHVLRFLERHLLPWTADRERKHDYRFLGLDCYEAHQVPEVQELAWSRGYIAGCGTMVPGGCTDIVQVPDTDLHQRFEAQMTSMQSMAAWDKLEQRPHQVPSTTRQEIVDFGKAIWQAHDHSQGERGFKSNGLSNKLDGTSVI